MPIQADVSSYPTALQSHNTNPLAMLQSMANIQHSFAGTQNLQNQNLQFQQQFAARQALGPILQSSIDPQTGQLDYNKAFIGMAGNPATAWMAPEFLDKAVARQLTQSDIALKQLELESKRQETVSRVASSLLSMGRTPIMGPNGQPIGFSTNVSPEELMRRLTDPEVSRIIPLRDAASYVARYTAASPQERYALLQQKALQGMTAKDSMDQVLGKITNVNLGGQIQPTQQSALMGTSAPVGAPMIQRATVAEKMQPITAQGPRGEEIRTPAYATPGAIPPEAQTSDQQNGLFPAAMAPGAPGTSSTLPTNAPNVGNAPNMAPRPNLQTPAQNAPANASVTTKLSPAQTEQITAIAPFMKTIGEEASTAVKINQFLDEMDRARQEMKTGGGTTARVALAKTLQALGINNATVDRVAGGDLGALQEFDKVQLQLSTQGLRQALLPGAGRLTQGEFSTFQKAYPNFDLDPRAIDKMFTFMRKVNNIALTKQQLYSQVYSNWLSGQPLPKGLNDATPASFDPWFNAQLMKRKLVSGATIANVIGGETK